MTCATRASRCTLASTIIGRTLKKNTQGATNICGWRSSPISGASGPPAKAKRKHPASVQLSYALKRKMCRDSCSRGSECIDELDRSWRRSAWDHRTTRAWNQHGVKRLAELLIKLAFGDGFGQRLRRPVYPLASFGLHRSSRIAAADSCLTSKSVDSVKKNRPDSLIAALVTTFVFYACVLMAPTCVWPSGCKHCARRRFRKALPDV